MRASLPAYSSYRGGLKINGDGISGFRHSWNFHGFHEHLIVHLIPESPFFHPLTSLEVRVEELVGEKYGRSMQWWWFTTTFPLLRHSGQP